MTDHNLLDFTLNNFYFTEERKNSNNYSFFLPPIHAPNVTTAAERVLDQSKQQWKNDVSQPIHPSSSSDDQTLTHIVSPEAILEALQEEEEEAPFSKFTSFNALKQRRSSNHSDIKLKRPPNAYLLFNRDMRRKLLKYYPKMTVAEISKEIGDSWKTLPDDQREYYVKTASKLKEEHLQRYPGYTYSRRSKAQLAEDKKLGKRSKSNKLNYHHEYTELPLPTTSKKKPQKFVRKGQRDPRGRKKKQAKHPFAPKHPMSAYLYYVASVYQQVSSEFPGSTVGPISKSISKTWHAMSLEERRPWIEKAESDKARYAREMEVYMANEQQKQPSSSSSSSEEDEDDMDIHTLQAVVGMVNNNPSGNPMYHNN